MVHDAQALHALFVSGVQERRGDGCFSDGCLGSWLVTHCGREDAQRMLIGVKTMTWFGNCAYDPRTLLRRPATRCCRAC